jgi:hypothetical protein
MDDRLLVIGAETSLCVDIVGDELLLTAVDSYGEMQAPIKAADEARLRDWLNKRAEQGDAA